MTTVEVRMTERVFLYARSATITQVEEGNSITSQLRAMRTYACRQHWEVNGEYVDEGKSGSTDQRSGFQRMIKDACSEPNSVDVVLVENFSRLFRNVYFMEMYRGKLKDHDIRIVSATQDEDDGESWSLSRSLRALMDELEAREPAERRSRRRLERERASQGGEDEMCPPSREGLPSRKQPEPDL
jgi:site-specific DNA recombinase